MKITSKVFRIFAYLLTILILTQSCNIYKTTNIGIEEAIAADHKVRITTTSNQKYIFKRIERDNGKIYGIANRTSKAAKQLKSEIPHQVLEDDLVKINLENISIQEIKEQNKTLSIVVPLLVVAAGILIFALTYQVNASPW